MFYEVFKNKNSSKHDFEKVDAIYKRIMTEDKDLCNGSQTNINRNVFVNGQMHPRLEQGPLYFQNWVRKAVTSHKAREQVAGEEIWPARQTLPSDAAASQEDIDFCAGLTCPTANQEGLAW